MICPSIDEIESLSNIIIIGDEQAAMQSNKQASYN